MNPSGGFVILEGLSQPHSDFCVNTWRNEFGPARDLTRSPRNNYKHPILNDPMNMKSTLCNLSALIISMLSVLVPAVTGHAAMTVQSLTGPVTATEISSFKTFIQGVAPPSANTYDNNMADGGAGMN